MRVPEPEEQPIAWRAILDNTPVFNLQGEEVGQVREVLGAEDIFHGLVMRSTLAGHEVEVPAVRVRTITTRRIDIDLTADEVRGLPVYVEEESYRLGMVGIIRQRLGWVPDREDRSSEEG